MTNVSETDQERLPDFPYTAEELRRVAEGVRNEGYPPAGRDGVGAARRKPEAVWRRWWGPARLVWPAWFRRFWG